MLVTSASQAAEAGDEPALIVQSTGVPMAVGPNRQVAIELLLASTKLDLIISDDGLQHWALGRQQNGSYLIKIVALEIESYYQKDIYVNLRNV